MDGLCGERAEFLVIEQSQTTADCSDGAGKASCPHGVDAMLGIIEQTEQPRLGSRLSEQRDPNERAASARRLARGEGPIDGQLPGTRDASYQCTLEGCDTHVGILALSQRSESIESTAIGASPQQHRRGPCDTRIGVSRKVGDPWLDRAAAPSQDFEHGRETNIVRPGQRLDEQGVEAVVLSQLESTCQAASEVGFFALTQRIQSGHGTRTCEHGRGDALRISVGVAQRWKEQSLGDDGARDRERVDVREQALFRARGQLREGVVRSIEGILPALERKLGLGEMPVLELPQDVDLTPGQLVDAEHVQEHNRPVGMSLHSRYSWHMHTKDPPAAGGVQIGQLLDGRYRIEALIGSGGMGKVYRATREQLGKRFAIKTLETDIKVSERAELVERFAREAQATAAIRHENVVEIVDFGQTNECVYFVMELLEGYVLADLIGRGRTLEPARMVPLAVQIANGLHAAHVQGTIHRDVKPGNIFICPNREGQERVKVLDFGLAKVSDGLKLTRAGVMFGTASYMSPEQALGASLDARTDVYALGCVLFESLAGRPPFVGDSWMAIIGQHLQKPPPRLAELCPDLRILAGLEELIQCALAKKAEQRFSGMEAMVRALMSIELPPPARVQVARPTSPAPASAQHRVEPKRGEPQVIELLAALYIMQSYSTDDELAAQEVDLITELLHAWKPAARLAEIEGVVAQARSDYEHAGSDQLRRAKWEETCEQLRDRLNEDQRRQVLASMWRIAGADGAILDAERQFIAATIERFNAPAISSAAGPVEEPTTFVRPIFERAVPASTTAAPDYEPTAIMRPIFIERALPGSMTDMPDYEPTTFVRPVFERDSPDDEHTSFVIPVFADESPRLELAEHRSLISALSSEPLLSDSPQRFASAELSAAPPRLTAEAPEAPPIVEFGFSSELIRERFEQCRLALVELLDGMQPFGQLAGGALVRWREHAEQLGLESVGARRELTVCFGDATRSPDERLTAALLLLTIAGKEGAALLLEHAALGDRESLGVTIMALELGGNVQHLLRGCADAAPEQRGAWLRALERQAIDPGPAVLEHALSSEQPDELAAGLSLLCMHEAREQHGHAVIPHLFAQEPDVRSAAIVAGLVLGLPQAPILLAQTARRPGMFVAALLHAIEAKPKQLGALTKAGPWTEDLAFALALCGRPRAITAVIEFVGSSASPRLLAGLRWSTGFVGTPSELPSWWAEQRAVYESDTRLLLGQPITAHRLYAALPRVTAAVWPALRLELLVRSKGALRLRTHALPDALLAASSRIDEAQLRWLDR